MKSLCPKKSNRIQIVFVYAPWCPHCQSVKPYLDAMSTLYKLNKIPIDMYYVDSTNKVNTKLIQTLGVQSFPTFFIQRTELKMILHQELGSRTPIEFATYFMKELSKKIPK